MKPKAPILNIIESFSDRGAGQNVVAKLSQKFNTRPGRDEWEGHRWKIFQH